MTLLAWSGTEKGFSFRYDLSGDQCQLVFSIRSIAYRGLYIDKQDAQDRAKTQRSGRSEAVSLRVYLVNVVTVDFEIEDRSRVIENSQRTQSN